MKKKYRKLKRHGFRSQLNLKWDWESCSKLFEKWRTTPYIYHATRVVCVRTPELEVPNHEGVVQYAFVL